MGSRMGLKGIKGPKHKVVEGGVAARELKVEKNWATMLVVFV